LKRLPPGPHGLPAELVERNQRERLIAAMAEVCEERGYAESSVAEIARRAGVSTASFYRQFENKRECVLAGFRELFERLAEALEATCDATAEPRERARAGACAAARLLAADPPAARLLSLEILAVGAEGVCAQHEAIDRLAGLLARSGAKPGGGAPPAAAWAVAAAMVSLAGRRAARGEAPEAAELEALAALL
jgi:AcrR family transcriptional regulator